MPILLRLLILAMSAATSAGIIGTLLARRKFPQLVEPKSLLIEPPVAAKATRRDDGALVLTWRPDSESVQVYAGTSPDDMNRSKALVSAYGGVHEITLTDLEAKTRYFFEIVLDGKTTLTTAERTIPGISIPNFRDIGGYPTEDGRQVRWNRVYRSSALADMTDADQAVLARLGIQLICDLRTDEEVAEVADQVPEGAEYLHLPAKGEENRLQRMLQLFVNPSSTEDLMPELYTTIMLDNNTELIQRIFTRLADPASYPMVIHCAAGKDRTGVVVALLLKLLGVSDEIIVADYTQSNLFYDHYYRLSETVRRQLAAFGVPEAALQPLLISKPAYIEAALRHMTRKYGTIESYLRLRARIDNATMQRIRDNLLS